MRGLTVRMFRASVVGMKPEIIRANLNRPGPFVISTSDGKEYKVPHRDFLFVGRHNLAFENERGGVVIIDPAHVVAISPKSVARN